ncbi:MAG: tryptophan--tRNA ligase [Candidatus Omnitrophica bacterium]|nr:tryptophan--tRNA ligase [Candidatus Omnitrophota bacterium]MBU4478373.1 tryptophan--tRNA ligase [Candidatus Omnitrophota bacterium]MCG2703960.1 tryptophan--tRNA ligase [Candidatus Omnitrophota bacterium]
MKKRILSGMRPTGKLHLGHLVGALKNWSQLQDKYECFFMVADWHALMSEYKDPSRLKENIIGNVIDWISCGIDPEKSALFVQSEIPEHLELFIVFSCMTPLGWLERCPTYKEQLRELTTREVNTYAFLGYPVLQAADILLYKSEIVPVGEDQLPHLELTREIAARFNHLMKKNVFAEPQAELTPTPRLMGLDGRKMSKSYENYIGLSDTPEIVAKKVMGMFTDPKRIKRSDPGHPQVCNVHEYYRVFASPELTAKIETQCVNAQTGCTDCKKQLGDILNAYLAPIRKKRGELLKDEDMIRRILETGREKAAAVAKKTMDEVRKTVGI